jgi:hypothetical protein
MIDQPRPVGERLFTDGTTRTVFEDGDGRQYVEDGGERIYWTWLPPADEPMVAVPTFHPQLGSPMRMKADQ